MTPGDLAATIYRHMGVPLDILYLETTGRPRAVVERGRPISELFGATRQNVTKALTLNSYFPSTQGRAVLSPLRVLVEGDRANGGDGPANLSGRADAVEFGHSGSSATSRLEGGGGSRRPSGDRLQGGGVSPAPEPKLPL